MEARRFDTLVKALGTGATRRRVLGGLLTGVTLTAARPVAAATCSVPTDCRGNEVCFGGFCVTCDHPSLFLCTNRDRTVRNCCARDNEVCNRETGTCDHPQG